MAGPQGSIRYALENVAAWMKLKDSWSRESSADPENWTPVNAAWGQCAVTALVVQDMNGGELLRSTVGGVSHYWNRLPSGQELDLTLGQFGPDAKPDEPPVVREREYVLSFPDTAARYAILREAMGL